jgi:DnaK suppressor protein
MAKKKIKKPAKSAKKAKPAKKKAAAPAKKPAAQKRSAPPRPSIIIPKREPVVIREMDARPLTEIQIQKFREILSQKREELVNVVARKKEQEIQVGEVEIGDEADIATRSVEKEMLFELTDSEKQTLDMIEAALRRIEKGVFGRCELCRKPIPKMRLDVMPWARYCIRCQSEQEIPAAPEPPTQVP